MDSSQRFAALKKLAARATVTEFADELGNRLRSSFAETFDFIKTQKLLTKFRDVETIRLLKTALSGACSEMGPSERTILDNHFDVCEFVQGVFGYLDDQASSLKIGTLHPDVVATLLLNSLEAHVVEIEKAFTSSLPTAGGMINVNKLFPRMAVANRELREALDTALVILNAPISKRGTIRDEPVRFGNKDFLDLVHLGGASDFLQTAFDQYSFHGFSGQVKRRSIVFNRHDDTRGEWYWIRASQRMANEDQIQKLPFSLMEAEVRNGMQEKGVQRDFWQFYENPGDASWITRAKEIRNGVRSQIEGQVSKYFDLSARFSTRQGPLTFFELIQGWAVLYGIATLARLHNFTAPRASGEGPFVVLADRARLVRLLGEEMGADKTASERIISQFTSQVASNSHMDLFYRPLLQLTDGKYLISPTFVTASRFDRNVFTIAVAESDLNQKEKGSVPVRHAVSQLIKANFKAAADFKAEIGGRIVTDIDIAGFKHAHLFLGQAKVVIEPDTLYDRWKVLRKLNEAAGQLDKTLAALPSFIEEILRRLGTSEGPQVIVPFIVTNSYQFTGITVSSYPVIDFSYLEFLLSGATSQAIEARKDGITIENAASYIKGNRPTGAELARLIQDPVLGDDLPEGERRLALRRIGPYKIHLPHFSVEI